ncbi:MAG TPA: hypothetical protein VFR23_20675 [Jiangellaceae bacterium]|nr:hypothetical protein [Jiangellaceae bacterium]
MAEHTDEDVVFAKDDCAVGWSAGSTVLKKGATYSADSPLVRERPDLFERHPTKVIPGRIERATRAPGEVRGSGRRRA